MPQPYSVSLREGSMSKPAATARPRSITALAISNEGASSSRDRSKFEFQFSDESSPPHESTSPAKSEQSTSSTSDSSVYSNNDDQSKAPLLTSQEEQASEAVAQRTGIVLTPDPLPALESHVHDHALNGPVEADLLQSKSKPGWRSSLRMSFASFMSRLFTPIKNKVHKKTLPETKEGDRKETERLDRLAARTALLPLR